MVVMQLPNGTLGQFLLEEDTHHGLRLVARCASYNLLTAVNELGWRILDITTILERRRFFASLPPAPTYVVG
jgi:hypothetical protein